MDVNERFTSSSRVRRQQGRTGEYATLGGFGLEIHSMVREITKDVQVMEETGYQDFPLQ